MFGRASREAPAGPGKLDLGEITPEGAAHINAALKAAGIDGDVSGYRMEVDAYAARHAFKGHGSAARESPRGQIALTPDNWAMIPDVRSAPDRNDYLGGASSRPPMFGILKRVNGHILLIEQARTGRNTLAVVQMCKIQAPK